MAALIPNRCHAVLISNSFVRTFFQAQNKYLRLTVFEKRYLRFGLKDQFFVVTHNIVIVN